MDKLLSNLGKQGVQLGLLTQKVDIEDTEYLSKYFVISEFNSVLTAGRNPVAFNGSILLKTGSEIQVECLDSNGNSLYIEQAKSVNSQYSDVSKFVISIHVYEEIYNGPGKLILVGTSASGEIVRWVGNITIDKTLSNAAKVRFYNNPSIEIRPLLYPVVDTDLASADFPLPPKPRVALGTGVIKSIVTGIKITNAGSNYTQATVTIVAVNGEGSGATAHAIVGADYKITSIVVDTVGDGYSYVPTVIITGDGTGATATAVLTSTLESIIIDDVGIGYNEVPTITISGVGTGGEANVGLLDENGSIVPSSVIVTNKGNGYSRPPTITFSIPPERPTPILNVNVPFSSSFYTFAVNPLKDTNKSVIDRKRLDIDYRLVITDFVRGNNDRFPSGSFNSQMEGKPISLNISKIQLPFSYTEITTDITASYTIKKVVNESTIILDNAFYYQVGKELVVANIVSGICSASYDFIHYNTNPDSNLKLVLSPKTDTTDETSVEIKESYAEVTYRNLKTYSGFVARHKLYRKSLIRPGDFQLISDEPLNAIELISDPITFNQAYDKMGVFYHYPHISKYWFTSSNDIKLQAQSASIINSMYISIDDPSIFMDGTQYVILKNDSIGLTNDNKYYPYDITEFNDLSGKSYNSNFISLKKGSLYCLSFNTIIEKGKMDKTSTLSFYFTSSIPEIQKEKDYNRLYGLKLAEVVVKEEVTTKYFNEKQTFLFTPQEDYYGTLVIVPYHCNVILSEISLKVYGDRGFSPEILFIRIPFPLNVKNEAFEFKAELFDINSNLIYSNLKTFQTFDPYGQSLYSDLQGYKDIMTAISVDNTDPNVTNIIIGGDKLIVGGDAYLPNLQNCTDTPQRLVAWKFPVGDSEAGKLCYTNISKLIIDKSDYISLSSYNAGIEETVTALAIKYDGASNIGRRIYIDIDGIKHKLP